MDGQFFCFVSMPVLCYRIKWFFFAWIICLNNFNSSAAVNRHLVFFKEMEETFHLHSYSSFRVFSKAIIFSTFPLAYIANTVFLSRMEFGVCQDQTLTKEGSCFLQKALLPSPSL